MSLIEGMDNFVLGVFISTLIVILHILYSLLQFVMKKRPIVRDSSNPISNNNEEEVDPDNECSVCLSNITNKATFICNHFYCTKCTVDYINTKRPANINCPMCRREVSIIITTIKRNEQNREEFDCINDYNYRNVNGSWYIYYYIKDIFYIVNRGIETIFEEPVSILYFFTFLLLVIGYLFLPVDLIPDDIEFFGYADDFAFVIGLVIWICQIFMRRFRDDVVRQHEAVRQE
mmetsp:Transcript_25375/g.26437  ORF Transcript_25375/g.26437 Transcript_25375/m.26437 type:complete len:232 (+) Transcript_25375:45-740(+)